VSATIAIGTQLGRYEIRSLIGEGGMGEVYLAEDTRLHRKVALKILPTEVASNQDRMRRFNQEAQAAAAINHPNIAQIYEIGEHNGTNFIAMEFIAHHWYEIHLRLLGRLDEALAEIKRAQELDPLSPTLYVNVSFVYFLKNDLGSALEQAKRGVDLDPNYPIAHQTIGRVYIKQRRYAEAVAEFQQDVAMDRTAHALKDLGNAYAVAGRRDEALAVVKELEEKYQKHESLGQYVALVYAGLGDLRQAFAWLEKDFQAHSGELSSVIEEPGFDPIRDDPQYADLLRRMGLRPWKT